MTACSAPQRRERIDRILSVFGVLMSFNLLTRRTAADRVLATLLCTAAMASCGGGTQLVAFAPTRLIAFGDEASVIEDINNNANGRKYTVNAVKADLVTLDCKANPIWIQLVGGPYKLVFAQCNPDGLASPAGIIRAAPGATVADVAAQVDAQANATGFNAKDLVTVLAGANDIVAQYKQFPALDEAQITAAVEQAGTTLAAQVNRIGTLGGKVLVSTVPNLGLTPYARAEKAAHADTDRAALLSRLTARFNSKLRVGLINDGRMIGLLFTDESMQAIATNPGTFGYANVVDAVCDPAKAAQVTACTTQTLIAAGSGSTFLWADSLQMSPAGHSNLAGLALTRARGNPF
jgi:outer membrane lipase/esterase